MLWSCRSIHDKPAVDKLFYDTAQCRSGNEKHIKLILMQNYNKYNI